MPEAAQGKAQPGEALGGQRLAGERCAVGGRLATAAAKARRDGGRARAALRKRLEERREEIEAAALTRVRAISDPDEVSDPAYVEGLRASVAAAVGYGIQTTGREGPDPPIPVALLAQARLAARVGIPLDTVLRRYFAGYSLFGYFMIEEAGRDGLMDGAELQRLLGVQAGIFDRLLTAIGEEHARETDLSASSLGDMQEERIERLLTGELVDVSNVPYDFGGWHLGAVGSGSDVKECIGRLARALDLRPLVVSRREEDVVWAWLGGRGRPDPGEAIRMVADGPDSDASLAFGEPGEGLSGWRLTHRQAVAALPLARRRRQAALRYADVVLLTAVVRDDLLETSLRRIYLEPLERERDGGETAKRTLRAYFEAERNVTATAATLGINRSTVAYRLQAIEGRLGRPPGACAALEVALRLDELTESTGPAPTPTNR